MGEWIRRVWHAPLTWRLPVEAVLLGVLVGSWFWIWSLVALMQADHIILQQDHVLTQQMAQWVRQEIQARGGAEPSSTTSTTLPPR